MRLSPKLSVIRWSAFVVTVFGAGSALAADWEVGVDYGGGDATLDVYVPDSVAASPGVLVALHYCGGTAQNAHGWFQSLADEHGFLILTPDVGPTKNCWDAAPERSAERADIANMVDFIVNRDSADPNRVFAAGASSGACMTQALLAAYPEVFAAGSVLAGVPAGAWTTGYGCCGSTAMRGAEEWGNIVRSASPGFSGAAPRIQLFHGTGDGILPFSHLGESEKQWTNVHGVSEADLVVGGPVISGWDSSYYATDAGIVVEVHSGEGKPHDLTPEGLWPEIVQFFGLDGAAPVDGTGGANAGTGGAGAGAGGADAGTGGMDAGAGGTAAGVGGSGLGTGGAVDPMGTGGGLPPEGVGGGAPSGTGGAPNGMSPGESDSESGSDAKSGCQMSPGRGVPLSFIVAALTTLGLTRRRRAGL